MKKPEWIEIGDLMLLSHPDTWVHFAGESEKGYYYGNPDKELGHGKGWVEKDGVKDWKKKETKIIDEDWQLCGLIYKVDLHAKFGSENAFQYISIMYEPKEFPYEIKKKKGEKITEEDLR